MSAIQPIREQESLYKLYNFKCFSELIQYIPMNALCIILLSVPDLIWFTIFFLSHNRPNLYFQFNYTVPLISIVTLKILSANFYDYSLIFQSFLYVVINNYLDICHTCTSL